MLHQKFLETAKNFSGKTALQIRQAAGEYRKYTYAQASGLARSVGFYFIEHGIQAQDRIAMILENGPEWPVFYFGILLAGATAVPIDPHLTEQEISNILADSGAKIVINKNTADEILKNLEPLNPDFKFPPIDSDSPASILYTSGTTAVPKGVVLTHRNFLGNLNSVSGLKIYNCRDNVLSILPLHHSYPFMATLVMPLLTGATVTYVPTLKPEEILSAMKETGVTILVGVPQLFYLFHKNISERVKKIPALFRFLLKPVISRKVRHNFGKRLRFFASGGARLDPKVAKGLSGLGFKILEGYGLTETSPIVTFNPVRKQKFGSVGMVIPDVEIKILNPDKNKTGEVLIKGPNVMKGYYKRPKETEEVLKSGWFYSGDFGHIDKDGYLFLTGRLKEIIVLSSGKNIYPEEIETHYQKSPFIKELCVLGILKEGATEELGAVIVPDAEHFKKIGEVNIREKIKWELETLSKEIAAYKRIMGFTITKTELPRTRLGKIKRYEVEKVYKDQFADRGPQVADHRLNDGTQVILNTDVGKKVVEFLIKAKGIKKSINADDHLELDLGIDSLGRVELAVGLEKVFGIGIPDEDFSRIFTVKDIIEKISEFILKKPGSTAGREVSDETMWKTILQKDPKEDIKAKIDLAPNFFAKTLAFLGTKCLYVIFKIFFRLKIEGVENIPKEGPFILCPNHSSYLDAFIVAASVPHKCELNLFFMGFKAYFIQPVIKNLIRLMRVIPVDPAAELIGAMQASAFVIHNKKSLCIFPEGQRSIDGEVKEFKKGIGILAKELNVTLVPVYIKGAFLAWPRGQTFPKPHPIKITFGKPIEHPVGSYEKIAHFLREALLAQTA